MRDEAHLYIAELLRTSMTRYVVNGTGTLLGVYHDAPAYITAPMDGLKAAFGRKVEGSSEAIRARLEDLAELVEAGAVVDQTQGLVGIGFILEVHLEEGPIHLLTGVFDDKAIHRFGWSRDEGEPRGVIVFPGAVDMTSDPFVAGLTAILKALTGGEVE
jgi:hypothetical protein